MQPETAMLIPIILVVFIGIIAGLSQLIPWLMTRYSRRGRLRQARAHLATNSAEIDNALVLYRLRYGATTEKIRGLLYWLDREAAHLTGEDSGLLLSAQEATLKELNHVQNGNS